MKKILTIIFSMLMASSIFFASGETIENNIEKPKTILNIDDVDVPTWTVGNSWTYYIKIQGDLGDTLNFNLIFDNLVFTIQTVDTTAYTTSISGKAEGDITIKQSQIIRGTLQDTTLTGTAEIEKSNIGFKKIDAKMQGKISVAGLPIKSFTLEIDLTILPSFSGLIFPINVGEKYTIPISDIEGKAQISFIKNPIYIDEIAGGDQAECTGKETKSVVAGIYEAYKIESDGDIKERYYAEEAGNIIKAYGDKDYLIDIYLKSTNYGLESGVPNKPSRPNGPTTGKPGETYTFTTSTTDPEEDKVYYLFSWGDGYDSGWLGPYDSGQTVTASHSWDRKGNFKVKVKAKDTEDHESSWSDPLSVSMPRSRSPARSFFPKMFNGQLILNRLLTWWFAIHY